MTDTRSGKAPVGKSVAAAWGFFLRHWARLIPAALVPAICEGVSRMMTGTDLAEATADPATIFAARAIAALGNIFFAAAVLRLAVRGDYVRPAGVAFGADELRLIGAGVISGLVVAAPFVASYFAIVYPVYGLQIVPLAELQRVYANQEELQRTVDPGVLAASGAVAMICAGLVVWVSVRLFMVSAATIGERRVVVLQSWGWSRDNFWRVLACMILSILGVIPAGLINDALVTIALPFAKGNAQTVFTLVTAVMAFVGAMAFIPVHAMAAHLYKGLRPADFVAR